ncbi:MULTISPECIES: hypothetical protein [unclassified Neptuniibacter]|uniref:hypothetical protein n=1 Tax=unclassified Neptuniibacter TaxID=2630693 RepID=UPI0026E302CD|nr:MULTISPECIES: hypothetical protein [unclassified Neptuniibacter]MDO6514587.1 hypothetical protein [Neptuniibacter sp. 2_MG-2023]MDO6594657.1 hypothetical protein [Neptuniibacter sp. 1_MG-2023]
MALDFHIGDNQKEASYQNSDASFDFELHRLLFTQLGLTATEFPLFTRLEDYYSDTKFNIDELVFLMDETDQVKALLSEHDAFTQPLDKLLLVCEKALKEKVSIWVFCD